MKESKPFSYITSNGIIQTTCDIPKISARKDRFSFMLLNNFRVNPFDLKELRNLFPKTKHDKIIFIKAFHQEMHFIL